MTGALQLPELMTCARRPLRLTVPGCIRMFVVGNAEEVPPPYSSHALCRGCPTGARHAGQTIDPLALQLEKLAPVCARCRRMKCRMVGKVLCVSCYNRTREVARGRNGKDRPPRIVAMQLHAEGAVVFSAGHAMAVRREGVADLMELMMAVTKTTTAPVAFGWAA